MNYSSLLVNPLGYGQKYCFGQFIVDMHNIGRANYNFMLNLRVGSGISVIFLIKSVRTKIAMHVAEMRIELSRCSSCSDLYLCLYRTCVSA